MKSSETEKQKIKVLGEGERRGESPEILQHRFRQGSQSPQLTNYLGRGGHIGSFTKPHCMAAQEDSDNGEYRPE